MPGSANWRFIDDGERPGADNMERDERFAQDLLEDTGDPTLCVYGWSPWAISLGHHQAEGDLDLRKCREDGIDVVWRPTGGRAILHAEELTYCLVMTVEEQDIPGTYNRIGTALLQGLRSYGIEAALERSQPRFGEAYRNPSSIPCFSSSARYEIVSRGRKLIGSAQRRYHRDGRTVVLQHGSLLCGPAHERLADYLATGHDGVRERVRNALKTNTISLREITGSDISRERLVQSLRRGFEESWGIRFLARDVVSETGMNYG